MDRGRVDWPSFTACIAIIVLVCVPLAAFPDAGERLLLACYAFIANRLGFLYAFAGLGVFVLLVWLAFGRYGKVKTCFMNTRSESAARLCGSDLLPNIEPSGLRFCRICKTYEDPTPKISNSTFKIRFAVEFVKKTANNFA